MATTGKQKGKREKDDYPGVEVYVEGRRMKITSMDLEINPMGTKHGRMTFTPYGGDAPPFDARVERDVTREFFEDESVVDYTTTTTTNPPVQKTPTVEELVATATLYAERSFINAVREMTGVWSESVVELNKLRADLTKSVAGLTEVADRIETLAERVDELAHNLEPET